MVQFQKVYLRRVTTTPLFHSDTQHYHQTDWFSKKNWLGLYLGQSTLSSVMGNIG